MIRLCLMLLYAAFVIGPHRFTWAQSDDSVNVQLSSALDCEKYFRFQEAWDSGNFSAEWDGRQLNTADVQGCTDSVSITGNVLTSQEMTYSGPGVCMFVKTYRLARGRPWWVHTTSTPSQNTHTKRFCTRASTFTSASVVVYCLPHVEQPPSTTHTAWTSPARAPHGEATVPQLMHSMAKTSLEDTTMQVLWLQLGLQTATHRCLTNNTIIFPGDHVKFGMPLATATTQLILGIMFHSRGYQQRYTRGMRTVRWALDYMVKAHSVSSDSSVLVAQVGNGDQDHSFWGRPEQMPGNR